MAGMGAGYDLSVSTFSPDGRVFQVEYAAKAMDSAATCMALVCKDGVITGVEKFVVSKMLVKGSNTRIYAVDKHVTVTVAGFPADARQIVLRARQEAQQYRSVYGEAIPGKVLAERVGLFIHAYTLAWSVRPFGAGVLVGVYDKENDCEPELYCVEPSGTCYKYFGTALGKGKQTAKTEMEKLNLKELTCRDAVLHVAKILHQLHDQTKDKPMEAEMGWICEESGYRHARVPEELVKQAEDEAARILEAMEDD